MTIPKNPTSDVLRSLDEPDHDYLDACVEHLARTLGEQLEPVTDERNPPKEHDPAPEQPPAGENRQPTSLRRPILVPGQVFLPRNLFRQNVIIPMGLLQSDLSPAAKLLYGRLVRYANNDEGKCFPTPATLGREINVKERQAQKLMRELERKGLIRRRARYKNGSQQSNQYDFLWHEMLEPALKDTRGVNHKTPLGVNYGAHEECNRQESKGKRDDRSAENHPTKYQKLRQCLIEYMPQGSESGELYPSDTLVEQVMVKAGGASEDEVVEALQYDLYERRRLRPGTPNGPRYWSWFPKVVGDHFKRKKQRSQSLLDILDSPRTGGILQYL